MECATSFSVTFFADLAESGVFPPHPVTSVDMRSTIVRKTDRGFIFFGFFIVFLKMLFLYHMHQAGQE